MGDALLSGVLTAQMYPAAVFLVFVAACAGMIFLFSGKNVAGSFRGLFVVVSTIFTTPFAFLRSALAIIRTADRDESVYAGTREFVLFRFSRLQYFGIFLVSALILAMGVSAAVVALYPSAEIQRRDGLRAELVTAQAELARANRTVLEARGGTLQATLDAAKAKAQADHAAAVQASEALYRDKVYSGPQIQRAQLATETFEIDALRGELPTLTSDCPAGPSWNNFTDAECQDFKTFVTRYVEARGKEILAGQAMAETAAAAANTAAAAREAADEVTRLTADISGKERAIKDADPFAFDVLVSHWTAALSILAAAIGTTIILVWVGAIAIDVLSWIILLMRSLEKEHTTRLD